MGGGLRRRHLVNLPANAIPSVLGVGGEAGSVSRSNSASVRIAAVLFLVLIGVHATGVTGQVLYPVVTLVATATAVFGVRRAREVDRRPWRLFVVAGLLWTVAGALRSAYKATGDLTASRSLLPDLFALPGYVFFALGLLGLLRASGITRDSAIVIDAVLIAVGSAAVVFATVVAPTLAVDGAWMPARLAVAVYPALSMWLLVAVVQLTLMRRHSTRGIPLIVAGSAFLLTGDVLFALGEIGTIDLPRNVLDLPYLAVAACLGCAALNPELHRSVGADRLETIATDPKRLLAVGVALLAPIAALATGTDLRAGRAVQIALLSCTAILAVARIAVAARSEQAAREQLVRRATHDQLTGLASRELVVDRARDLLDNPDGRPIAVMFLDLDEFKLVNDSLGHAAGDLLLMEVSHRLASVVREGDIVGRTGGDEFVIVTVDLDADGARALGDRIRRRLRSPFLVGLNEVFVTTSIGITMAGPTSSAEVLMQEADTAMYRSKARGRNHVTVFDPSMLERVNRRVELEQGLRRALRNDEVSVVFQPIIDRSRSEIEGFEALMRWSSAGVDYSPVEFMDIAEDSGLIVSLGEFVLSEACRQLAYWRRVVPGCEELTMSVNLSARQVQTSNIVDVVANVLESYQLPGEALWLEITESVMLDDTATTIAVMNGLRMLGVRLAVDDFGTGFSSLSYLRTFPVDRVKIDRSFITEMTTQATSAALIEAVVGIGRSMDLDVVAEGVETADQEAHLTRLGCRLIQGYLYAEPVSADLVPELIERYVSDRVEASTATSTAQPHASPDVGPDQRRPQRRCRS